MSTNAIISADRQRLLTRAAQTLLGICAGLIADGDINETEIHFLRVWLQENSEVLCAWPGSAISGRVDTILADGMITAAERADLLAMLQSITGMRFTDTGAAQPDGPASLPIDDTVEIAFIGTQFCFTGKFIHGPREACHRTTAALGGVVSENVVNDLDYLVIGSIIRPDWAYQSYGRKIEKAAQLRKLQGNPAIISEKYWAAAVHKAIR